MVSLSRLQIFEAMESVPPNAQVNFLEGYILEKLGISECSVEVKKDLKSSIKLFISKISKRRSQFRKNFDTFVQKSKSWLDKEFNIPKSVLSLCHNKENNSVSRFLSGRPKLSFENASERTKRRKSAEILSSYSLQEVAASTSMAFYKQGKRQIASHITKITSNVSIPRPKIPEIRQYTEDEALSLFVEGKFTKNQYKLIRLQAKDRGFDLYPSYNRLLEAKKRCYPDYIEISDKSAEVSLQSLLDHTTSRLLEFSLPVLNTLNTSLLEHIELIVKWGFDGSSGQSRYKQNTSSGENSQDSDLFATWLVPLQLQSLYKNGQQLILWKNPRPSSVRFCRPLRFQFVKETQEVIRNEKEYIELQIWRKYCCTKRIKSI